MLGIGICILDEWMKEPLIRGEAYEAYFVPYEFYDDDTKSQSYIDSMW